MMAVPRASLQSVRQNREFHYDDQDFSRIQALAKDHAGIHLSSAKRELVYARLARRLRQLGLKRFSQYCDLLERDGSGAEIESFSNAITTNLTSFFRESHHFAYLKTRFLPTWRSNASSGSSIRIWSAGCSTGEEPYSIAMTALAELAPAEASRLKILATDVDTQVLGKAAGGIYPVDKADAFTPGMLERFWLRGRGSQEGYMRASSALRSAIDFRRHNLVSHPVPDRNFDIVFCRNVMIYFDPPTQLAVYQKFAEALKPGGLLMVGHSEGLLNRLEQFAHCAQSTYRRQS